MMKDKKISTSYQLKVDTLIPLNAQMPDLIVDYDMSRQTFSIVQQEELDGASDSAGLNSVASELETNEVIDTQNYEDNNYQSGLQGWKLFSRLYSCERKEVVSHDGVKVPLTILYSRKAWLRDQSPGLLQAYGAYGEVLDKSWCTDRLSLLDRGWVVAFADVRLVSWVVFDKMCMVLANFVWLSLL